MKLTYIYHSGFAIEGNDFTIIIDYYKDTSPDPGKGYVHSQLLQRPGRLYVLASHSHADHFNPEILKWKEQRPDIQYLFSEDIRAQRMACFHDAVFLEKGEEWNDDLLKVQAFGSTDIGISFLLDVEMKRIFHAGDLNNWHWEEESTPEETQAYEHQFSEELNTLATFTPYIDLAMFPVDPRLGKDYTRGARQFIEKIKTGWFAPMHFWENYDKANAFQSYAESRGCKFAAWQQPGDSILF